MAVRFSISKHQVTDLCLGKPPLRSISITDTIFDALYAIKKFGDDYISVWNCHHSILNNSYKPKTLIKGNDFHCKCIGRVCMLDIVYFLCKKQNLSSPENALRSPISLLLGGQNSTLVRHIQPNASLVEAIDAMYEGVQNVVIPIPDEIRLKKRDSENFDSGVLHNDKRAYCWLTQEDVMRYLLNSIGVFSPTPATAINTLGVIDTQNLFVLYYDDPASSALELLTASTVHQSSVAVIDQQGKLVGEISPFMLNSCDEAVAPAMATLSAGDILAYIDCCGPPEDLVQLVKERLNKQNLGAAVELLGDQETGLPSWPSFSSTSSSEEDICSLGKNGKLGGYSSRVVRRSEAIVCYPWSSLVAVMIQALAHRVNYVWVVQEDGTLNGIVTFQSMLKFFREHLKSMS